MSESKNTSPPRPVLGLVFMDPFCQGVLRASRGFFAFPCCTRNGAAFSAPAAWCGTCKCDDASLCEHVIAVGRRRYDVRVTRPNNECRGVPRICAPFRQGLEVQALFPRCIRARQGTGGFDGSTRARWQGGQSSGETARSEWQGQRFKAPKYTCCRFDDEAEPVWRSSGSWRNEGRKGSGGANNRKQPAGRR